MNYSSSNSYIQQHHHHHNLPACTQSNTYNAHSIPTTTTMHHHHHPLSHNTNSIHRELLHSTSSNNTITPSLSVGNRRINEHNNISTNPNNAIVNNNIHSVTNGGSITLFLNHSTFTHHHAHSPSLSPISSGTSINSPISQTTAEQPKKVDAQTVAKHIQDSAPVTDEKAISTTATQPTTSTTFVQAQTEQESKQANSSSSSSSRKRKKAESTKAEEATPENRRKKRRMTREEDELLKQAIAEFEKSGMDVSWKNINKNYFNGKYDSNFLYQRWNRVLKCPRRQEWTDNEALELLYHVREYGGTRWTQIRQIEYECHFSDTMLANAYKSCVKNATVIRLMQTMSTEEIKKIVEANKQKRASWEKPKEFLQLATKGTSSPKEVSPKGSPSSSSAPTSRSPKPTQQKTVQPIEKPISKEDDEVEGDMSDSKQTAASRFKPSRRRKQPKKKVAESKYGGNNIFDELVDLIVAQETRSSSLDSTSGEESTKTEDVDQQKQHNGEISTSAVSSEEGTESSSEHNNQ